MMIGRKTLLALCGVTLIGSAGMALAQEDAAGAMGGYTAEERQALRERMQERYDQLTPEERDAMRDIVRERHESMTREERDAIRRKIHERREAVTPEEREAIRQEARERYDAMSPEEQEAFKQKRDEMKRMHQRSSDRPGASRERSSAPGGSAE